MEGFGLFISILKIAIPLALLACIGVGGCAVHVYHQSQTDEREERIERLCEDYAIRSGSARRDANGEFHWNDKNEPL